MSPCKTHRKSKLYTPFKLNKHVYLNEGSNNVYPNKGFNHVIKKGYKLLKAINTTNSTSCCEDAPMDVD